MNNEIMYKRSWVEVDLAQLMHNYHAYASQLPEHFRIMTVVKADAYGHGDAAVSKTLQAGGVSLFAVSNIDEAIALRKAGITGEILILGYTPIEAIAQLEEYDITQTLLSEEYAKLFSKNTHANVKCQFAINTGMNRIGLDANDIDHCGAVIRHYSQVLCLNGIFTHLCVADSVEEHDVHFTQKQINLFETLCARIEDLKLPYIHCLNSAGGLKTSSKYGNIVRLGIALYGLQPSEDIDLPQGIAPALQWKSVVSMVHMIRCGETVGYGCTYQANKNMRIATIPTGYADGYSRMLSNKGYVLIHGQKANVVGRICMDQMMVDITDIPDVVIGDEVILIGQGYSADDMAHDIGTIGYEVLCNISKRVARVYINAPNV